MVVVATTVGVDGAIEDGVLAVEEQHDRGITATAAGFVPLCRGAVPLFLGLLVATGETVRGNSMGWTGGGGEGSSCGVRSAVTWFSLSARLLATGGTGIDSRWVIMAKALMTLDGC